MHRLVVARRRWLWGVAAAAVLVAGLVSVALAALLFGVRIEPSFVEEAALWKYSALGQTSILKDEEGLRHGDKIYLQFKADRETWVYVINEDDAGHRKLLFPSRKVDLKNPLPGGLSHKLPGAGEVWPVDDQGGRESIFLVASRSPLGEVEALGRSQPETYPEVSKAALREILRGIDDPVRMEKLLDGKEVLAGLIDELERLAKQGGAAKDLWVRKFSFKKS